MKRLFTLLFAVMVGGFVFGQTLTNWLNENPGNVAFSQETTTVQDGSTALGIVCTTDAQADTEVVSATFTVTPGATFTASAYIMDNDIAGKARIAVNFDGTNEWGGYSNDGTEWELVEMTGTVPDGVTTATFFFRFYDIADDWDGDFECILDNVVYSEDGGTTNLITNGSFENWETLVATEYTIVEIQDTTGTGGSGSAVVTEYVETTGIVTGVYDGEFTMQNGTGEWTGIWVAGSGVAMGDDVTVTGTVSENNNLTKILSDNVTVNSSGNALPAASVITTIEVSEEAYEGVLVESSGACTNTDLGYGEWSFDDGSGDAVVDDYGLAESYVPTLSSNYTVTSPIIFSFGAYKFAVRQLSDIVEDIGTDPYLAISSPEESATLSVADVNVTFNVQNFVISSDASGDGYIVYTLDSETPVDHQTTDPIALVGLADGAHAVVLELVDNSGASLNPAVTATVNFTVNTAGPSVTPIYDIQYTTEGTGNSPMVDQDVTIKGIVTAVNGDKFYMQDAEAAWSGIYVYYTNTPGPAIGDSVVVNGTVVEYSSLTEISPVATMEVLSSGNTVTAAQVSTGDANTEAYESVLVEVTGVNTAAPDSFLEWPVNDGSGDVMVDDFLYAYTPVQGNTYRVTGVVNYFYNFKILPRDENDVVDLGVIDAPAIFITSPANGSTVYVDAVDVSFTVSNFVLGTDGKVAYSIDGGTVAYQTTTDDITFAGLTDGSHTVTLELVDMSDASLDPAVSVSISFIVDLAGPTITPIYDIQYSTSGDSPMVNQIVTIEGVVTASFNESEYGDGYYVQDAPGAWNALYIYDLDHIPAIGDSVRVTGKVSEFNEMTEMTNVSDLQTIGIGGEVPAPIVLTTAEAASEEQYESCLVKVENAECITEQDSHGEWIVNDGSGDLICKENGAFDFTEVIGNHYNVTGVINYSYDNFTLQYRIASDIEIVESINSNFALETEVYPNPAVSDINISNMIDVERIELIDVTGQVVISNDVNDSFMSINVENLASGVYMLKLTNGLDSRVIRVAKN